MQSATEGVGKAILKTFGGSQEQDPTAREIISSPTWKPPHPRIYHHVR